MNKVTPLTGTTASTASTSTTTTSNRLHMSSGGQEDTKEQNPNPSTLKYIQTKSKPIALTIFTVLSTALTNVKPSFASAPVTPIRQFKPQDQKKIALEKMKAEQNRIQMQSQMEHQLKCEEIEQTEGKAAREAFEKEFEQKKVNEGEARVFQRKELLYGLLQQGICPFMDLEGERQVYEFDNGIDLATVPTTPQQKEFMNLRRNPKLGEKRAKERFIIKCIVDDLIAKGEDPLEYMQNNKDKTMEIFSMNDKKLDAVVARYRAIVESQGSLSGVMAEQPFSIAAAIGQVSAPDSVDAASAAKAAAKAEATKLKAQKKAEQKAAKAEAAAVKAEQKAQKKAEAAKAKAEQKAAKEAAKAEAAMLKVAAIEEAAETVEDLIPNDSLSNEDVTEDVTEDVNEEMGIAATGNNEISNVEKTVSKSIPLGPIAGVVGVAGVGIVIQNRKAKSEAAEEERQKQFRLIMGLDDDETDDDADDGKDEDILLEGLSKTSKTPVASKPAPVEVPKKRRKGLASVFSKKGSNRETDLNNLVNAGAKTPEFSMLLAKVLSFGAPGRFPLVKAFPGGMPMEKFDLNEAKKLLIESRTSASLTDEVSAEAFACVVNCMIIDIIDLASSSLGEEKKSTMTVDALNVVMDFMDHAASLFDAVADGVSITPVTYGGTLPKSKLEKMFTIYASSLMTSMQGGVTQDRIDTLQQVFNINEKRAEGLIQKGMMKNLMNMMKNPEDMEGMEGMEGLSEMMAAMGGEGGGGMPGMPGFDPNGEVSPEELKQSVAMMKELVDSGSVSKEELDIVRQQFAEAYGSDINDLIKAADEGKEEELGEDGKELLDLFKTILKED